MINEKIMTLFSTLFLASTVYAGEMGPALSEENPLFASIEGAYTWNSIQNQIVNAITLNKTNYGWGGRVAAGAIHQTLGAMSYSAELGWGYYDRTTLVSSIVGVNRDLSFYGLDLLLGGNYRYNQMDYFLKLGGMVQNMRINNSKNISQTVPGGMMTGHSKMIRTTSVVAPEIKVGGIYNLTTQLGLSLAYTYVFGNDAHGTSNNDATAAPASIITNSSYTGAPISLSSLMLGLRYRFG